MVKERKHVIKIGGSSLTRLEERKELVASISRYRSRNSVAKLACILSAEQNKTDNFIATMRDINPMPPPRERDAFISLGENQSICRAALAATHANINAASVNGWQAGILTTGPLGGKAYISDLMPERLESLFARYDVLFVAGFQGVTRDNTITTLGRGGSDITAVAVAAALGASDCLIVTDTDGVYRADPRLVTDHDTRLIPRLHYDEAVELAWLGTKVIHPRAVEIARKHNIELGIGSYEYFHPGTIIGSQEDDELLAGITVSENEMLVKVHGVPNQPGSAWLLLTTLFEAGADIDLLTHIPASAEDSILLFSLNTTDFDSSQIDALLRDSLHHTDVPPVEKYPDVAKISLVGNKLRSTPGFASRIYNTIHELGVRPRLIGGPRNRVSMLLDRQHAADAVRTLYAQLF